MPTIAYAHYDVFTDRPFEGNQLAVFPDARGLTTAEMQALANEMNFAESTFVLPAEAPGTDARLRIFTPGREMPMAGHPTIGSTFALADAGVIAPERERWVFGLNVGPTAVALEWRAGRLACAWMDQGVAEFRGLVAPAEAVLAAVGAGRASWVATGLAVVEGSCGAPYFYVPQAARRDVDACVPDAAALRALTSAFADAHVAVLVFTVEPGADGALAYARMFALEAAGVVEDPATGSAMGPLAAYLVERGVAPAGRDFEAAQGVALGRPSRLRARVAMGRAHVGGAAVRVGEGILTW